MDENQVQTPAFDIEAFLQTLTHSPGVYKMLGKDSQIIYVGKAKDLKKRVSSYFRTHNPPAKQRMMLNRLASIEVIITHTEGEALLLESRLIKQHQPRYNISLRDDKSYPYIHITTDQTFPRITFHRGAKRKQGQYFGPYPSAKSVRYSLKTLQQLFPVRQCDDTYYKNRSRPCLQYQIKRCTAPCVNLISAEDYQQDVDNTLMFLQGESDAVIQSLIARMELAAEALNFERAGRYRDQIATLRSVLEKQYIEGERGDVDIIACHSRGGLACVHLVYIRNGQQLGDRAFFPKTPENPEIAGVLEAFIGQYYLDKPVPKEIIVTQVPENAAWLAETLTAQSGHVVSISSNVRSNRKRWLKMAQTNAENGLSLRLANKQNNHQRCLSLQTGLSLVKMPRRFECFDISHTQGDFTVASCVVFNQEGPLKSAYRRFNIEGITAGDDYAALAQAVTRRFKRLKQGEHEKPDILFIDGGKGQLSSVCQALDAIEMNDILIVGVAKGPDRRDGMESIFVMQNGEPVLVQLESAALLLIQHIRDEAHRFAITAHRQRRGKAKKQSVLESIQGLGPKKRQSLLKQFGGLQAITRAGIDALCGVEGINRQLAQRIYETFHEQGV